MALAVAPWALTAATTTSVIGPCSFTTNSCGIAPNTEATRYTKAFATAAAAAAYGPTHSRCLKATRSS